MTATMPFRRARQRVRAVAVATVLAVAATLWAHAAPARADECASVLFIGARGSGQAQDDRSLGYTGFGREVATALDGLRKRLPSTTLSWEAVDYPAAGVPRLYRHTDEYFLGLNEGVSEVRSIIDRYGQECPHQQLVLSGYSQGAMVMHRVLLALEASRSPILSRVAAVVLFGDGDRVSGDTTVLYGDPHPGLQGIGQTMPSQSGSVPTRFSEGLGARVRSVCLPNDPVCDSTGMLFDLWFLDVHMSYPTSDATSRAVDDAADFVAAAVATARSLERVTFTSVGLIHLGMTADEARADYLDLVEQELAGGCGQWEVHEPDDPGVVAYPFLRAGSEGRVTAIHAPPLAETDRGVGVGSTLDQVRQAYRGVPVSDTESQVGQVLLVEGVASWLGFNDLDYDGRVDGITVSADADVASGFEVCSDAPTESSGSGSDGGDFVGDWYVHGGNLTIDGQGEAVQVYGFTCGPDASRWCSDREELSYVLTDDGTGLVATVENVTITDDRGVSVMEDYFPLHDVGDQFRLEFAAPHLLITTPLTGELPGNPYWCRDAVSPEDAANCGA